MSLNNNQDYQITYTLHHFNDVLASQIGVHEAIMVNHFIHWITLNKRNNKNNYEGRTWSYQKLEDIAAHFVYLSKDQVKRILNKLVHKFGILKKGNFNKVKFDRTMWYAFEKEELFIKEKVRHIDMAKSPNGNDGIATPIPDNKTYNEKESLSTDRDKKDASNAKASRAVGKLSFISVRKNVKLTEKQIGKLKEECPNDYEKIINRLNDYKEETKKIYSSDYKAILRWVIGAIHNEKMEDINKDKIIEKNKRFLKEMIEYLIRHPRRGDLRRTETGCQDLVLNKSCLFSDKFFSKKVAGWYNVEWREDNANK